MKMSATTLLTRLDGLRACGDAIDWVRNARVASDEELWTRCRRGDWLLWFTERVGVDRRLVTLAACDCAREALGFVPAGEDRPRLAIEAAEAWARGSATLDEVHVASDAAAYVHAASAAAAAYVYTTDAAAHTVYACDAAAAAASAAYGYTADTAASAAASAADAAAAACTRSHARTQSLARGAELVRARIPLANIQQAMRDER